MSLKNLIFFMSILFAIFITSCRLDNTICQNDFCDHHEPKSKWVFDDTLGIESNFMLEFKYNAQGKVLQQESFEMPNRVLVFRLVSEYNVMGQLIQEKRFSEQGQASATKRPPFVFVGNTTYQYENGRLISRKDFNLDRQQMSYLTYTYDSQNRLKTIWRFLKTSTKLQSAESYDYDEEGRVILQKQLGSDSTVSSSLRKIYKGNLLIKTQTIDNQGNAFWHNDFIYDGKGNILETLANGKVNIQMTYCNCNLTQKITYHPTMGDIWYVERYKY